MKKTLLCMRGSKPYWLKGSKVYIHLRIIWKGEYASTGFGEHGTCQILTFGHCPTHHSLQQKTTRTEFLRKVCKLILIHQDCRISMISASAALTHQQRLRISSIGASAALSHLLHRRISSIGASAASRHQ